VAVGCTKKPPQRAKSTRQMTPKARISPMGWLNQGRRSTRGGPAVSQVKHFLAANRIPLCRKMLSSLIQLR
jgi:hypothetical protein